MSFSCLGYFTKVKLFMALHKKPRLFLIICTSSVLAATALATTIGPSEILENPSTYDGKHVTVSGVVEHLEPRTSRKGNDYETFDLCDNSCLKVFIWGHPSLKAGQALSVIGTFDTVKHVGRYVFHDELDADEGSIH